MKVAIVGSRDWPTENNWQIEQFVQELEPETVVVSGGARGVDTVAVEFAERRGLETEVYLADWKRFGKSAGSRRNKWIVGAADRVVAFWDGESRGTANTIWQAKAAGTPVTIIAPEETPQHGHGN